MRFLGGWRVIMMPVCVLGSEDFGMVLGIVVYEVVVTFGRQAVVNLRSLCTLIYKARCRMFILWASWTLLTV
jgi:hypothetical protein